MNPFSALGRFVKAKVRQAVRYAEGTSDLPDVQPSAAQLKQERNDRDFALAMAQWLIKHDEAGFAVPPHMLRKARAAVKKGGAR